MRDSFTSLENQNIKLTFNGTASPEQPRQSKRYAYNSVDYINFSSGLYFLNVPITTSVKAAASLSALTSSNPKNRSHAFPFSFTLSKDDRDLTLAGHISCIVSLHGDEWSCTNFAIDVCLNHHCYAMNDVVLYGF